ncbi:MAG: gliding motility-associated C-terminal domain-containing protein [Saprospiraceae bacterium]
MNKSWSNKVLILLISILTSTYGQSQLIADYSFDGCTFSDQLGNYDDAKAISLPSCDCGLTDNGLYFDGVNDNLNFPSKLDSLLEEDFTVSFYFQIDNASSKTNILSIRSECNLDSFISISYTPLDHQIAFDMSPNIANIQSNLIPLNKNKCWHSVILTKSELVYTLYIDDQLGVSIISNGAVKFPKSAKLSISNSPCLVVNEDRFNGWIDEFKVYDRALSFQEIISSSLNPDQIVTNDTTVVAGADVQIHVGSTCAQNYFWNPITNLDDETVLDPIATPEVTTEYKLTIQNKGGCSTIDSLTINVIDPDQLDCEKILLPNAFTPNNDQLNDNFGISNLFLVEHIDYFEVYDRWGAKMWETNNKTHTWDGTFKNKKVNPGMYIYKVKYTCNDEIYVKVDNFSVLR